MHFGASISVPDCVLVRDLDGESVALNLHTERYYGLDEAATRMWTVLTTSLDIQAAFEVTSGFGTVGLSTGITPELSTAGRIIIMLTIFTGRVGLLTVAFALTRRQQPANAGRCGQRSSRREAGQGQRSRCRWL